MSDEIITFMFSTGCHLALEAGMIHHKCLQMLEDTLHLQGWTPAQHS